MLGFMYYAGYGVEQNYEEALLWFTEAAKAGDIYGKYCLG